MILCKILVEKSWLLIYWIFKSYLYTDNKIKDSMATMKQPWNVSIIHLHMHTDNQWQRVFLEWVTLTVFFLVTSGWLCCRIWLIVSRSHRSIIPNISFSSWYSMNRGFNCRSNIPIHDTYRFCSLATCCLRLGRGSWLVHVLSTIWKFPEISCLWLQRKWHCPSSNTNFFSGVSYLLWSGVSSGDNYRYDICLVQDWNISSWKDLCRTPLWGCAARNC